MSTYITFASIMKDSNFSEIFEFWAILTRYMAVPESARHGFPDRVDPDNENWTFVNATTCSKIKFMVKTQVQKIRSSISYLKDQSSVPRVESRIIHQAEIIPLNTFSLISSGSPRGISPVIIINAVMKHSTPNFKTSFCIWSFPPSLIQKLTTQNFQRKFRVRPRIKWLVRHLVARPPRIGCPRDLKSGNRK